MEIAYANSKIQKLCTDDRIAQKKLGKLGFENLRKRLSRMETATCLEDLRFAPGGWHELTGDRKGQLACSIIGLFRLVFEPNHDPVPTKPDGGLDWTKITAVKNIEIVDYH